MAIDKSHNLSPETFQGMTQPEQVRRKAALVVCGYATDVTDAGMLLNMLGLDTTALPRGW